MGNIYIGDPNGIARKVDSLYIGDANGIARKVQNVYIGDASGIARQVYSAYIPKSYSYTMFDKRVDGWYYYAMSAGEKIIKTIPKTDIDEAIDSGCTSIYGEIYSSTSDDGVFYLNHDVACYIRCHFPSGGDYPRGYYFYKEWDTDWSLSSSEFNSTKSGTISLINSRNERADRIEVYMENASSEELYAANQGTSGSHAYWRVSASLHFI